MFAPIDSKSRPSRRTFRPLAERLEARECLSGGLLDPTFNGSGTLNLSQPDAAITAALQADGKLVVAGNNRITRLNPNGALDTAFGGSNAGGLVTLNIKYGTYIKDMVIQPNGKVLVSGTAFTSRNSSAESEYFVARLNANGTLDTTFGKKGVFEWNPRAGREYANQLAVLSDGSIIVGGSADSGGFTAFKLTASGARVTSFAGGEFRYDFGGRKGGAAGMAIAPNGSIILAGNTHAGSVNGPDAGAIVALTPSGRLDTAFNGTGILETLPTGYVSLGFGDVAIQGNAIIVSGTFTNSVGGDDPDGFVPRFGIVSRYSLTGVLDTTFGSSGSFTSDAWGAETAVAADGSLIVGGSRTTIVTDSGGNRVYNDQGRLVTRTEMAVAHLSAAGVIDTGFGTDGTGFVYLAMGADSYAEHQGVLIDAQGRVIVHGFSFTATGRKAALARLTAP